MEAMTKIKTDIEGETNTEEEGETWRGVIQVVGEELKGRKIPAVKQRPRK